MSGSTGPTGPGVIEAFRGDFPRSTVSARQIANSLTTPGCERRSVLDLAEIDMRKLASILEHDSSSLSSFAITRSHQFESLIFNNYGAVALDLARRHLNLDVRDVAQVNIDAATVRTETPTLRPEQIEGVRLRRTRRLVADMLAGTQDAVNLLWNPLTPLTLGDRAVVIEHDLMLFASTTNEIHLVEIRDYPEIDGVLEPTRVGQTKREAAIALISARQVIEELRGDPAAISTKILLITPKQLLLTPVARVVDVSNQVTRLQMLIDRVPPTADVEDTLRDVPSLPAFPGDDPDERSAAMRGIWAAVSPLAYRLGDGCSSCALHRTCRDQARVHDTVQVLGAVATQTCGSVETITRALGLARGEVEPGDAGEQAVSVALGRSRRSIEFATQMLASAHEGQAGQGAPNDAAADDAPEGHAPAGGV